MALAALAACARLIPAPPPLDARVLLAGLERRQAGIETLSLTGRGSLTAKGRTLRGDFALVAAKPGMVRLEAYGPFGLPALFVVMKGEEVRAVSFLERRYLVGKASSPKLAALLPLSLSAAQLIALLSAAPLPEQPTTCRSADPGEAAPLQMAAKQRGSALLVLEGSGTQVQLLFGEEEELLAASLSDAGGEMLALYSDWRPCLQASRFPFGFDFSLPGRERGLRLEVSEARLNEPLSPATFELEPPPGFKVVQVK